MKGNVIYFLSLAAIAYMWWFGDYQYQNVFTAYMIIILAISTAVIPLAFAIAYFSGSIALLPGDETKRVEFEKSVEDWVSRMAKKGNGFRLLYMAIKSVVMCTMLALTGYTFILVWYISISIAGYKLFKWSYKEKVKGI